MPDLLARIVDGRMIALETYGFEPDEDRAKYEAARRWVFAVDHWNQPGASVFHVRHDPQRLGRELAIL